MKTFILIDSNAIIYKCFYALPKLTTPRNEPSGAVYGFTSILLKILRELKPDYMAAAFDMKAPTFRHKEFKEYKAKRPKAPQELYDQIPKVKEILNAFEIPIFEKEGFEADDIIGTLAKKIINDKADAKIIILTGDMDTLQLVQDAQIVVYALKKGISNIEIYDESRISSNYGLKPFQLIDYRGLKGDPSDNISGVKGIGEKTALSLIQKFGSIENLYQKIKKEKTEGFVKEKVRTILLDQEKEALFSKYLSTIKTDVPLEFQPEKISLKPKDNKKIIDLFKESGFTSLIVRLEENYRPKIVQNRLFDN